MSDLTERVDDRSHIRLRVRLRSVALAVGTIALGLLVHVKGEALPPAVRDSLGDALWAMMIFWWVTAAAPRPHALSRAVAALAICWTVELSQLYHAPGIDSIRATTLGHLMLGSDFDARDLAAYAVGIVAAVVIDQVFRRRSAQGQPVAE